VGSGRTVRTQALLMPRLGMLTLGIEMLKPCSGRRGRYSLPHILPEVSKEKLEYEYKVMLDKDFHELISPFR
jgi:hypothetical protein